MPSAYVSLTRGLRATVTAEGGDRSVVEGVAKRLKETVSAGQRRPPLAASGLRLQRPGEVSRLTRLRERAGTLGFVAVTAAISATVGAIVTKLLS